MTRVPNLRPASPHSSRSVSSDRLQRTAQKPAPVTSRKQAQKTPNATGWMVEVMRLERTWISYHAALEMDPCAAFRKESRMKLANATNLDWKSG